MSITLEEITAYSSIVTTAVGFFALYQIKIAKDNIKSGVITAQASEAARQCERYIESFMPMFREVEKSLNLINYRAPVFSYKEALEISIDEITVITKNIIKPHDTVRNQILDALNHLEIMSVSFVKSIASEDIAYQSLVFSYCHAVDRLGVFALTMREETGSKLLFSNMTVLYNKWEPMVSEELKLYSSKLYAEQKRDGAAG